MEDVLGAIIGLLIMLPFTPFIALAIKLESPGPWLVELERVSNGKVIKVYKFRSMVEGAHKMRQKLANFNERSDGPFFKIKKDPRVTKVGKVLRKFRIDEFPQLWNVLTGELALVGPRPHEPGEIRSYPQDYRNLVEARAGVTGLSQVNGASSLPFLKELELDEIYLQKITPVTDLKILFKTFAILFFDPTAV